MSVSGFVNFKIYDHFFNAVYKNIYISRAMFLFQQAINHLVFSPRSTFSGIQIYFMYHICKFEVDSYDREWEIKEVKRDDVREVLTLKAADIK